jgi:hypothetical protein
MTFCVYGTAELLPSQMGKRLAKRLALAESCKTFWKAAICKN